ncbi:hypothetical protein FAY30_02330 [Bacillus sp. S3]|uniref:hypothetical protein n=1 Tax=Bacillus sp. S3 TaxID=486398 RepID=UPI00118895C5|nr:hypothetical protein [Bacillus sp. S3]QCJ40837.1 hypothetical protein FAY30_02330 [Bacillus sp. S3]
MDVKAWDGQLDNIAMRYKFSSNEIKENSAAPVVIEDFLSFDKEIKADKVDCLVAVSSGILTAALDVLWVGEFSLRYAQDIGTEQINNLIIEIAKSNLVKKFTNKECKKDDLKGCIKFLEDNFPLASDKLTNEFGGGLQHHLRDFSHHASPFGLICSILNQFTGKGYGTDTDGKIITPDIPETAALGKSFEERVMLGVVGWFLHLVSDMAGSSGSSGRGTGIPGPLLSLAKVLSATPLFKELNVKYKDDDIGFSVWISKLFNGTAFEHTNNKDLIRFDLRTEIGIGNFAVKQAVPVLINQCIVRSFYLVRRLAHEYSEKEISSILDLKRLEPSRFMPFNNRCITRMITLATGTFSVVDSADAVIRAKIKNPKDNAKVFSDTLLRINFAGVGAFVLSIKNEVKYVAQDVKGLMNRKTKAEMILEQQSQIEKLIQNIDVEVLMDNSGLYEYAFDCMYNHVKKCKDDMSQAQEVMMAMQRSVLITSDNNSELYSRITRKSTYPLMVETEKLIMRLFTLNNVTYKPFDGDEKYNNMPSFTRMEDGKRIAYIFSTSITERVINWKQLKEKYQLDGIKVIALVELQGETETINIIVNHETALTDGFVTYETLKDLFALLGENEYGVYKEYATRFNNSIRELIGYSTVTIPSKDMMDAFKKNTLDMIKAIDYKKYVPDLRDQQIEIINRNYFERELNRAVLGDSDLAESFLSAEWYYSMHTTTSGLEQTAIVAGYLKAVEQLLYKIVRLSINTGKDIKKKGNRDYIEYSDVNESDADITLASLIGYVKHYQDLWDVNKFARYYITDKLTEYRIKYRNDHFHKDNVYELKEIEEIRDQTLLAFYLILGACSITDDELPSFNPYCDKSEIQETLKYEELEKWLDRILGGDTLLDEHIPIYFKFRYGQYRCELQFNTVSGFTNNYPDDMKYPYVCDSLYWPALLEKDEAEIEVIQFIKGYLENGKYAAKLKQHKMVSVGHFGHPQIVYEKQ